MFYVDRISHSGKRNLQEGKKKKKLDFYIILKYTVEINEYCKTAKKFLRIFFLLVMHLLFN